MNLHDDGVTATCDVGDGSLLFLLFGLFMMMLNTNVVQ